MHDLLVRGGTVVTAEAAEPLDVIVDGERIAGIDRPGTFGTDAAKVIDADGYLVLPGGVDPHVHYNLSFGAVTAEPQEYSPAAALGGTKTVIDFALQEASQSLHEAVAAKKAEAAGQMAVDYSFRAIIAGPDVSFDVVDEIVDVATVLRGSVVVEDGTFVGAKDGGRFLARRLAPDVAATPPDFSATSASLRVATASAAR